MCKSSPGRFSRVITSASIAVMCLIGCSNAPREAAPLDIERAAKRDILPASPPTIRRVAYENVLSQSPGHFFQRMPVSPVLIGKKFIGYSVLALYAGAKSHAEGVLVGDIVARVNGLSINTPDAFHKAWLAARGRRILEVEVLRDNEVRKVTYRIID